MLCGCAAGPDFEPPHIALAEQWTHGSQLPARLDARALSLWWKAFDDPLLGQLMDEAIAGNLDVTSAKAKIREARAARREAAAGLFPVAEGSASAQRIQTAASPSVIRTLSNQFQGGLDASWELDFFGAIARSVEAASYGAEAAGDDLRAALLTLSGDVAANYIEARGYQARIELARRTVASQRETAGLTRAKFEAGSASAVDTAKADALAASTAANLPSYEASYAEAVHRLSVLTGREPGFLIALMKRPRAIPTAQKPLPAGIPADILRNRPDVRAAEWRLAQATAKIGQAEAALYPSVSLTGSLSTTALSLGDLGRASTIGWSWGPSVSVPIFQGGKLIAARDVAAAQRDEYLIAWHASVLAALEDVENALIALAKERIRFRTLAASAGNYRKAAELSRELYRAGKSSFLDVLDAERSLYSAEDSLIQSRITIAKDYVALAKALGGGWDKETAMLDVSTRR
ncbi:MAG: efflux transporter outer membrane subunit [Rhodomicrobium sp.]